MAAKRADELATLQRAYVVRVAGSVPIGGGTASEQVAVSATAASIGAAGAHGAAKTDAKAPAAGASAKAPAPAATAAAAAAKPKYVPPPPAEVPRSRRAPLTGVKLPIPGGDNVLITSALPYVNNVPHLGNLIGCVLSADVYARYCRQRGRNCVYICGTDEYGTATETKAAEEGVPPRAICDKYFAQHTAIYDWFDISFDHFGRTSCPDPWHTPEWPHTRIAQDIFLDNFRASNLVQQSVEQVYCLGCEKFLADRFIEGECPLCHYEDARGDQCDKCGKLLNATELLRPRCKADKEHRVEVRTSDHMFLDLGKLQPLLEAWIDRASTEGKWTDNSTSITRNWTAAGLKPRCITRDLKWGTPVPAVGDAAIDAKYAGKVFYVWFDAPIGYISITATYTPEWKLWWQNPDNVKLYQFMGKDNVPFHTVIFPSSLIGSGQRWTMLHHVSTTEYLNYETGKFSKSRGVGVFGDNARETGIPSEVWRYYLLFNRPENADTSFNWDDFAFKNNNELLKNLGNLVQRALSFAYERLGGKIAGIASASALQDADHAFIADVNRRLKEEYLPLMDAVSLRSGLHAVMGISAATNGYLQAAAPWDALKSGDVPRAETVISVASNAVRLIATIAEPFIPGFTDKVCYLLNLPHADIPNSFEFTIPADHPLPHKPTPLFSAISDEQIAAFRARFSGSQADDAAAAAAAATASSGVAAAGAAGAAAAAGAPAPAGKKGGKATAPAAATAAALPDIARVDLRVGQIVKVWPHPDSDKLWCEEIDVGEDKPRQILSGLRHFYSAEQMLNRRVIVVANLKPKPLAGMPSAGMVLCAANADRSVVEFVDPPAGAAVGERVMVEGLVTSAERVSELLSPGKKNDPWTTAAPELRTDAARVATFKGIPLMTSAGPCTAPSVANGPIS